MNILVNGESRDHVGVADRGFQYGDGVFETLAVYRGAPLLWQRHLARLQRGAARLGIGFPSAEVLTTEADRLCQGRRRAVLKLMLTRGVGVRGYAVHDAAAPTRVLSLNSWPEYPREFAHQGVSVGLCETRLAAQPRLAGIKHLNRLEQVLARAEWCDEFAEGLMRDDQGDVIEGTKSNVFVVADGVLRTPDLSRCGVDGIMRGVVLEAAQRLGLPCEIGRLGIAELAAAAEVFLSNSLIGVWPVRHIMDTEYAIGPVTRKIQQAIVEAHCFDRD